MGCGRIGQVQLRSIRTGLLRTAAAPHRSASVFLLGLPGFRGMGSGGYLHKRSGDAAAGQKDDGGVIVKRVRLARKARPGLPVHSRPDPGLPTPERWQRLFLADSTGFGCEVGATANLVRRSGCLEPAPGGYRHRVPPRQSRRGGWCDGPGLF